MKKTAIILGASGLTGSYILQKLIADDRYDHIKLFSRSKIKNQPEKVEQFVGDLLDLSHFKPKFIGDVLFCCIGTTKKKTPEKALYKKIDYGIPVAAAKLAKANNIKTFLVISAVGANANSKTFYTRTKGEMERDVLDQKIENTFILRPSLIDGDRNESRIAENIALKLFKVIQPLFMGKLRKYKIIDASTIAQAMINLANRVNTKKTSEIITSDDIYTLA